MKLLFVVSLLVCGAVAEPPAPYPPSGWRPSGSSFDLPQRAQAQEYLPPLDPRNPNNPSVEYGVPEEDVSVQGLPAQEEVQFFQNSPINGQQNVGTGFKSDIRNLDQGLKQTQYQQQQQTYRKFDAQKQIDAQNTNRLPKLQPPTFARTTPPPTEAPSTEASTTELSLNEEETSDAPKNAKVSVEVSRQKLQEYPGELFLSSLAQLQLQPQFVPLQQFGQSAPLILQQPSQKQVAGYDAQTHFAALPSVLAQQQLQQQNIALNAQSTGLLIAEQRQPITQYQPVNSYQQTILQSEPVALQPQQQIAQYQPQPQLQPNTVQYQPQQFPPQSVVLQPQAVSQLQPGQPQPNNPDAEPIDNQYQTQLNQRPFIVPQSNQFQPQQAQFQPQPAFIQAQLQQGQYQPQPELIQVQPQQAQYQPQQVQYQPQQAQYQPQQAQFQPQPELIQVESQQVQYQPQQAQYQPQQAQFQPQPELIQVQPEQVQYQPRQAQYQPEKAQYQPQQAQFQPQQAQFQPQPELIQVQSQQGQLQPQQAQYQPEQAQYQPEQAQFQPQQAQFQPQPELIQVQSQQVQLQPQQAMIQAQPITYPNQGVFLRQRQFQSPDALQSGLDVNQQGNDIEDPEDDESEGEDEGNKATAVATAFGTRTQPRTAPRVYTQYGAPFPVPKVQASPGFTTTESPVEDITEDAPVVAQAVAVADGRRKNARLRSRRVRPLFTLDRSGHLVLAQGQ